MQAVTLQVTLQEYLHKTDIMSASINFGLASVIEKNRLLAIFLLSRQQRLMI